MSKIKRKIKSILTNTGPKVYVKNNNKINYKKIYFKDLRLSNFGDKNKDKFFFIINRSPGSGFFSNFVYILNQINICNKLNLVPVIDMKNFKTIYNDKGVLNNKNAWNYYFENINKFSLEEVYKSKNVIFSSKTLLGTSYHPFEEIIFKKKLRRIFTNILKKNIFLKREINKKVKTFIKRFKRKKTLGIHLRGTTYKNAPKHPFPLSLNLSIETIETLKKKFNYERIFVITEEQKYLDKLREKFGNELLYYDSYRSFKNDAFKIYSRKNHRYKLGEEILVETLIMSHCDGIVSNMTNVSSASIFFSKKKIRIHKIFLGYNSNNKFIASFLWYVKLLLPKKFFGFNLKIKNQHL